MPFFRHKKTRIKRVLSGVHVCYSPRGTALRSVAGLKQFIGKKSRHFTNKNNQLNKKENKSSC
ncbi:hypothetical protein DFY39_22775 [Escherichia coli]|nr:hypothetical protein [Escherichia coli]EEY9248930.1 hypothetical protein [Escherichia coli]EEY9366308.1 hypothetical protein [Escherichia coli]EEY9443252.1 hypothetical protein [Escherichia coli]EEZ0166362.1 hypothetical protein [Escherichia coli]